jgi:hypothetical protein
LLRRVRLAYGRPPFSYRERRARTAFQRQDRGRELAMVESDRVARLRRLAAVLERLPATASRDGLLIDVRGRLVAVDAGASSSSAWRAKQPAPQAAASAAIALELGPRIDRG